MSRFGERALVYLAVVWLLGAGAFLFVKGLDISLVACRRGTCEGISDLVPGVASYIFGVSMLVSWPFLLSDADEWLWLRRLGLAVAVGAAAAAALIPLALAVTDLLGVPLWVATALIVGIAMRPPDVVRSEAIRGRVMVGLLIGAGMVGAEIFLEGDAYILAFTTCLALVPPMFAGVDDLAMGWRVRTATPLGDCVVT